MHTLFGTKIFNKKTKEVGLLIKTWVNKFADGDIMFATCVDEKGNKYNISMDLITPFEEV